MDSFPTLIPIKHVLKVSKEELKTKLHSREDKITAETKAIMEIPDLECRIDLQLVIQQDAGEEKDVFVAFLTLLNIEEDVKVGSSFVFCIKPAGFLGYGESYHTHDDADSFGVEVCTMADLFDQEKKFITNGEFVIEMKGIIFLKKEEMKSKINGINFADRLWEDEDERDFTIIVKEDDGKENEIKVHKIVLALRSPVFQRMFKTDMKEKLEGKVKIIDFDMKTVKSAIKFCYDREIFDKYRGWQQLINLQKFADKYDIESLKKQIELYLVGVISFENICAITNAAINLNAPKLQDFCFHFLLISTLERIQIKDIDKLDNGIAAELLKKSLSVENY